MFIVKRGSLLMFGGKAFKTQGEAAEWLGDRLDAMHPDLSDEDYLDLYEEYDILEKE